MARRALSALLLTALACDVAYAKFGRNSFHEDFIFGTGSAAYQVIDDRRSVLIYPYCTFLILPPLCLYHSVYITTYNNPPPSPLHGMFVATRTYAVA
jgi:hypothetical protein